MAAPLDQIEQKLDDALFKLDDNTVTTNKLLFELKYKGNTSYLLPTCHLFPYRRLHEDIKRIINNTDILVSETEKLDLDLDEFFIPDLKKLYNKLSLEEKNKLEIMFSNLCKAYHINRKLLIEDIPLWCFAFLTLKFYWPELGIDFELHNIFKTAKKRILGLDGDSSLGEDLEEDTKSFFRQKNDEEILNNMKYYLSYEHITGLHDLFNDYIKCKPDVTYAFDPTSQEDHNVVTSHNFFWTPKMMAILEHCPSTAFFAVGMTHLFGPTGLLNILRESGVSIRRMGVDGQFYPYHADLPTTCSAKQLEAQQLNYEFLKSQILKPQEALKLERTQVSWLYEMVCKKQKKENALGMCYEDKQKSLSILRRYR